MATMEEYVIRAKAFARERRLPITYLEFNKTARKPVPEPPYIIWIRKETVRGSDCTGRLICEIDGSFELYTDRLPDPELEEAFEAAVLNDLDYEKEQVGIKSENMVMTSYDFHITQKRLKNA